jgi:hypothetical protein
VDAILEPPDRSAVPSPDPIVGSASEDRPAVGREADAALPWFELEADFPGDDLKGLLEVFSV